MDNSVSKMGRKNFAGFRAGYDKAFGLGGEVGFKVNFSKEGEKVFSKPSLELSLLGTCGLSHATLSIGFV